MKARGCRPTRSRRACRGAFANRTRSDYVSADTCISTTLSWDGPITSERLDAEAKAKAIVETAILNEDVRNFRIRWVANGIYRYKTYEAVKAVLYTVGGPDTMKTTLDMAEMSAFEPLISFVTLKGGGGGLGERAIINARERIHKVAEARQTKALMEAIKDTYCALNNKTKTRGYASGELTSSSSGVTKANFTSNFEDMLALPGQHVLDKIILIMEFSANGERLLPKLVSKLEQTLTKPRFQVAKFLGGTRFLGRTQFGEPILGA